MFNDSAFFERTLRGRFREKYTSQFFEKKKGIYFWGFLAVGVGCSGQSFAVEGARRGKPLKSRVANFLKKKGTLFSTFGLFWLWEETGYVWDVVAGPRDKPVKSIGLPIFREKKGLYF